jgi:hypothetical protein
MTRAYESKLFKLFRQPSRELGALRNSWPDVKAMIDDHRHRLSRRIHKDDPIRGTVDLLNPLGRTMDEAIHSRALAYLLSDEQHGYGKHGYGKQVLDSLVEKVKDCGPRGSGAAAVLTLLRRKRAEIVVTPEFRYPIENDQDRSAGRCDIWVKLRAGKRSALIVIENKINAPEGSRQLQAYSREACAWCRANNGIPLLIYLAPVRRETKSSDGDWVSLSYLELASALRRAWLKEPNATGKYWLSLYIVSVMRGILGFDIRRTRIRR